MSSLDIDITVALNNFNLHISQTLPMRGIIGVFGHSGSGKSTLLRTLSGLVPDASGHITLHDRVLLDSQTNTNVKAEQRRISLVFQDSRLFPHLTVKDNLLFAAKRSLSKSLNIDEIISLTELSPLLTKSVTQLSGGEQQRVALARAILVEPSLLLLDEPLSALDSSNKSQLLALLIKVQKELAIPMLYVSHSLAELQQVADKLLILKSGKVTNFGDIHQVIHQLNFSDQSHQQTSLSLPVKKHFPEHGLTTLALNDHHEIYLPLQAEQAPSGLVRCFIPAGDISITLSEPNNSSIVNHLSGEIIDIAKQVHSVLLTVNCYQQAFYVRITSLSFEQLSLHLNMAVYIQFKAGAVHTLKHYHGA
ncbi:molybdenum ABC transporter ATP-binding protein [Colwelliaceae bacterium 6471]